MTEMYKIEKKVLLNFFLKETKVFGVKNEKFIIEKDKKMNPKRKEIKVYKVCKRQRIQKLTPLNS